jgi:hypothetical protein
MQVQSLCTVPVGGFFWQPRFGGHAFVVVAKATFELRPKLARLAMVQDALTSGDRHWQDDPAQSVYAPDDLVPFRDGVDVTLVGDAVAHKPAGSHTLVTRLRVGDVDKKIVVFGERWSNEDGRITRGKPFRRMPLRYEHAHGGDGSDNPIGIDRHRDSGDRILLPSLEPYGRRGEAGDIACFGPIPTSWPSRRRALGDVADTFSAARWREQPLPAIERSFFNAAPHDQRLDELSADERLLLENLHPHLPRLDCALPGLQPRAFVERSGGAREVFLQADALWIDMTRLRCTVTWRGSFEVAHPQANGRVLVALEQPGERLCWPDVAAMASADTCNSQPASEPPPSDPRFGETQGLRCHRPKSERPSAVRLVREQARAAEAAAVARRLDRAVGDDCEDTVILERPTPIPPHAALPFVAVPKAATRPLPLPSPPSRAAGPTSAASLFPGLPSRVPPPSTDDAQAQSPWARGAISQQRHEVGPPPTASAPVEPPPLMLVRREPAGNPASSERQAGHVALVGREADDASLHTRLATRWPDLLDDGEPNEESFEQEMRRIFGTDKPTVDGNDVDRAVVRVLSDASPQSAAALVSRVRDAVVDGFFCAPLIRTRGELVLRFDEEQTLQATLNAATPHLGESEPLDKEVARIRKLQRQGAIAGAPDVAEALTAKVMSLCDAVDRETIEARVERQLLQGRHHQRRTLLGAGFVVAMLHTEDGAVPCYLPEELRDELPLYARFPAHAIAELHARQDQFETSPIAMKCLALGRFVSTNEKGA